MRLKTVKLFLLAFALLCAGCQKKAEVKGRIVIPEADAKLGRDQIRVVSEEEMKRFIKEVEDRSRNPIYESGSFNTLELSKLKAVEETTTDDEGNFSLTLPAKGKVALVATIKRSVKGEGVVKYHWVVWVPLENQSSKSVTLDNDNRLKMITFADSSNLTYIKSL
jgi:hypothetical protein